MFFCLSVLCHNRGCEVVFYIPELLSNALFPKRCLLGLFFALDLPFPCGQITVELLHKDRGLIIQPLESLYVGIPGPIVFLGSEMCSFVSGVDFCVDSADRTQKVLKVKRDVANISATNPLILKMAKKAMDKQNAR